MLHIHSILYIYHYISIKHQIAVINHQGSPLAARVIAPTKHKNSWQCRLDHLPAESPGSTCENWVSKKKHALSGLEGLRNALAISGDPPIFRDIDLRLSRILGDDSLDSACCCCTEAVNFVGRVHQMTETNHQEYFIIFPYGYGSIPIDTIFRGLFTSINPSYFDVNYRGTRF